MSNITSASGEASVCSGSNGEGDGSTLFLQPQVPSVLTVSLASNTVQAQTIKRKRNLPGTPDADAEVIALSPKTLLATNRFICEICNKGFQRDQNLQLHRRGHNLPWKLKQRTSKEIKKRVYVCPETSCVHHDPSRALGDLTGIKKHFSRKHGEKKWKCEKCSKRYAVQSDWKAHSKTCGTREYRCDCGTLFSRRDSFITHRAFCDALAEESGRVSATVNHSKVIAPRTGDHTIGTLPFPGTTNIFRFGGSPMDRLSSSSLNHGLTQRSCRIATGEYGLPLVQPNWEQSYPSGSETHGTRPRLSLWLGTGPGPGPPNNDELTGGPQQLQPGGSKSLNLLNANPDFFLYSPKGVQVETAMTGLFSPPDYEGEKPLTGQNISSGYFTEDNHYSRLFAAGGSLPGMSGNQGQKGGIAGTGMPGLADSSSTTDWTDPSSSSGRSLFATSGGPGNSLMCGNVNGANNLSPNSSLFNQAPNHTPQISATALLQKAAQMGATVSNATLLRGFGMAGSDSSSANMESAWKGSRSGHGGEMPTMASRLVQSHKFMNGLSDIPSVSHELGNSFSSAHLRSTTKNSDNASLQELMSTLSTNALFGGLTNLLPSLEPYSDSVNPQFSENGLVSNQTPSTNSVRQVTQHLSNGRSQHSPTGTLILPSTGFLARGEDGPSDKLTHDFLGVGVDCMVGTAGGGGRTVSQRNVSDMTSLGTGMDTSNFHNVSENLGSIRVDPQSSGKPWYN
eukprot:c27295_g1_i1 orf=643-2847(-)